MQSFIITFYRCGCEERPEQVIGTFENPSSGLERRFTSMDELHRMLDEERRAGRKIKFKLKAAAANSRSANSRGASHGAEC